MNINPFSSTSPHYDSYDDFYKFFEVYPKEDEDTPFGVFPPVQQKPAIREVPVKEEGKDSLPEISDQSH